MPSSTHPVKKHIVMNDINTPIPFRYRFNRFEPGLFVEIYLPKKIRYQGALYEALRAGFDFDNVKAHLTAEANFFDMIRFLEDYEELRDIYKCCIRKKSPAKIVERVNRMSRVFYGYSLYEVDGVFFNATDYDQAKNDYDQVKKMDVEANIKAPSIGKFIAEENVQVIRIMFMPDINSLFDKLNIYRYPRSEDALEEYYTMREFLTKTLESQYSLKYKLRRKYQTDINGTLTKYEQIYTFVSEWIDDVALFLFGFLLFNICKRIIELEGDDERPEDEIWVTSFGNLEVNKIKRR